MFPGLKEGEWEPVRVQTRIRRKEIAKVNGNVNGVKGEDVEMSDAPAQPAVPPGLAQTSNGMNGDAPQPVDATQTEAVPAPDLEPVAAKEETETVEEESFEDDPYSLEGAVYPLIEGRIENWSCFFALLSHIYKTLSPHFHSPLLIVAQSAWSARDKETITQFVFENWKVPAFCMFDSALAACYAYATPSALVVDVGLDKCDVTAVTEFVVNENGRAVAIKDAGGRSMTRRLHQVLAHQGFDETMAEQLKKSPICEILPQGMPMPTAQANAMAANPAAAASTGAMDSGANPKDAEGQRLGQEPRGPGLGTEVGEENEEDNEGVLDVAAIVARDNAAELVAKREAEKAAKAAAKKGGLADGPKQIRLKNSEKEKATFTCERFMAATPLDGTVEGIIDTIAAAVHRTALAVTEPPLRSPLWENLIILGNGCRVKGRASSLDDCTILTPPQASPRLSYRHSPRATPCLLRQLQSSLPNFHQISPPQSLHLAPIHPFQGILHTQ
jgi:actin-related protein 9